MIDFTLLETNKHLRKSTTNYIRTHIGYYSQGCLKFSEFNTLRGLGLRPVTVTTVISICDLTAETKE